MLRHSFRHAHLNTANSIYSRLPSRQNTHINHNLNITRIPHISIIRTYAKRNNRGNDKKDSRNIQRPPTPPADKQHKQAKNAVANRPSQLPFDPPGVKASRKERKRIRNWSWVMFVLLWYILCHVLYTTSTVWVQEMAVHALDNVSNKDNPAVVQLTAASRIKKYVDNAFFARQVLSVPDPSYAVHRLSAALTHTHSPTVASYVVLATQELGNYDTFLFPFLENSGIQKITQSVSRFAEPELTNIALRTLDKILFSSEHQFRSVLDTHALEKYLVDSRKELENCIREKDEEIEQTQDSKIDTPQINTLCYIMLHVVKNVMHNGKMQVEMEKIESILRLIATKLSRDLSEDTMDLFEDISHTLRSKSSSDIKIYHSPLDSQRPPYQIFSFFDKKRAQLFSSMTDVMTNPGFISYMLFIPTLAALHCDSKWFQKRGPRHLRNPRALRLYPHLTGLYWVAVGLAWCLTSSVFYGSYGKSQINQRLNFLFPILNGTGNRPLSGRPSRKALFASEPLSNILVGPWLALGVPTAFLFVHIRHVYAPFMVLPLARWLYNSLPSSSERQLYKMRANEMENLAKKKKLSF